MMRLLTSYLLANDEEAAASNFRIVFTPFTAPQSAREHERKDGVIDLLVGVGGLNVE